MKAREHQNPPRPDAIRRLYEVFKRYPARPDMPRCGHCATPEEVDHLCRTPVEKLTEGSLHYYTWHAIYTVGEVIDFKHFLPRIFETMLWEDGGIDSAVVVGKLAHGEWRIWPQEEQDVIGSFFEDWWKHLLSIYPAEHDVESCLCAIAQVEDSLSWFLDYWRHCSGSEPLLHLAALLQWNYGRLMESHPIGPWWDERPQQMAQLRDWILSPLTGKALNEGFFAYCEQPFAKQLSDAVQQFEWVSKAQAERNQ